MGEITNLLKRFEEGTQSGFDYERYINLSSQDIGPFLELALKIKSIYFDNLIKVYVPGKRFPAISVTGNKCALSCEHCNKKYLKSMIPITKKEKMKLHLERIYRDGGTGALISGGCLPNGSVPLLDYLDVIKEVKKRTNLIINVHTGLVDEKTAKKLAESKVDIISFDLNLDNTIIQEIYHLDKTYKDYINAFKLLQKYKLNVVPHICIGLHYGRLHSELESIKFLKLSGFDPSLIVLIALIPPNIPKSKFIIPEPYDIAKIISLIRFVFPKAESSLGCMRPRGKLKIDIEKISIKAGINRIELPSKNTLKWAKDNIKNLKIRYYSACCAIPQNLELSALSFDQIIKRYEE